MEEKHDWVAGLYIASKLILLIFNVFTTVFMLVKRAFSNKNKEKKD